MSQALFWGLRKQQPTKLTLMDLTFWWCGLRGHIKKDKYIICQTVISDRKTNKAVEVG